MDFSVTLMCAARDTFIVTPRNTKCVLWIYERIYLLLLPLVYKAL